MEARPSTARLDTGSCSPRCSTAHVFRASPPGLRSMHLLASAVLQVQQSAYGEDAYPTMAEKAAAYGYFISQNHPFVDGNKRTAALAMMVFRDVNGYELVEDEDAIAQVFQDVAHVIDQGEFFGWVVSHAKPARASNVISITTNEER
jgi:death-on-curing protein